MFLMPLLQQLKRVREERGMSPRELSARTGVSADSISDFEELRRMASQRTAWRLARALGDRLEALE
jgi:transcriptional regulator with XRE-family HTH domain